MPLYVCLVLLMRTRKSRFSKIIMELLRESRVCGRHFPGMIQKMEWDTEDTAEPHGLMRRASGQMRQSTKATAKYAGKKLIL